MEVKFSELSKFQDKQKLAEATLFKPECKYLLYGGAVGGGKSYWLRWTAVELAMYYSSKYNRQDITIGLFSEDYPTLKDRQISRINTEFPSWLGELKTTQVDGLAYYIDPKFGGGKILLRNLDDPAKYASSEFAAIGVEELTKNPRETFDALRHRLRFPGITDVKFFAASNPGGLGHAFVKSLWIDKDTNDPETSAFFYVPASYRDNSFIDTETYERQLSGLPEELRRAFMDGDWNIVAGQAFSELRREVHIIDPFELPRGTRYFIGYDHGFNHPFSAIIFAVVPDGTLYVVKHIKSRLKRVDEISNMLLDAIQGMGKVSIYAGRDIWARQRDGSPSVAEQFRTNGISPDNNIYVQKAKIDRIQGAQEVRKWLAWQGTPTKQPRVYIFRNAQEIYDTLANMQFDSKKPEDVMKVDADVFGRGGDDDYDAFRYGIMSRAYPNEKEEDTLIPNSPMDILQKHLQKKQIERSIGWYS